MFVLDGSRWVGRTGDLQASLASPRRSGSSLVPPGRQSRRTGAVQVLQTAMKSSWSRFGPEEELASILTDLSHRQLAEVGCALCSPLLAVACVPRSGSIPY